MKKVIKLFFSLKKEQDWLTQQKGWKLVHTNGFHYRFEESNREYYYEYIYFHKSKKELKDIMNQIQDSKIEFICNSSSWALFRKDTSEGTIQVLQDNYYKYKALMNKNTSYIALGSCYLCLGSSQIALSSLSNSIFGLSSVLFYFCSFIFFLAAASYKNHAIRTDDGTYAARLKKDKN
jgi:hypothetical protein